MENDKDIKIETEEDVGLDDKIKAGAKAESYVGHSRSLLG